MAASGRTAWIDETVMERASGGTAMVLWNESCMYCCAGWREDRECEHCRD